MGRGGRGGRGGSGFAARGTPALEFVQAFVKVNRGKGGHRVKKSDNARIQALYHRKHALRHQFKQVAQFQRDALDTLAEKALDLMTDPNYHKTLPEYQETTKALAARYQRVVDNLETDLKIKQEYLRKQLAMNEDYTRQFYDVSFIITSFVKQF
jgi:hypothetical protein